MKIIYSNQNCEELKENMITLLELRQRLYVDVIAGEKGKYENYLVKMAGRITVLCILFAVCLFNVYMFLPFGKIILSPDMIPENLRIMLFITLFWVMVCIIQCYIIYISSYRESMIIDAIPDKFFREDIGIGGGHLWWEEKGYFKRNQIRGPKREYPENDLYNRFCFGWIDRELERKLNTVLGELYHTAALMKWLRYITVKSNEIQQMLKDNEGDVCVTVEKLDYCKNDSLMYKIASDFNARDRHVAYRYLKLSDRYWPKFGYMVTVSIKDREEKSEDRISLVYKTQTQMYLDEYEYQQIFRTKGIMDLSYADQKYLEMKEACQKAIYRAKAELNELDLIEIPA